MAVTFIQNVGVDLWVMGIFADLFSPGQFIKGNHQNPHKSKHGFIINEPGENKSP